MRIESRLKLAPFSHRPGTCCLIPTTTWEVTVYPAKLMFRNLADGERKEYSPPVEGPVKGFTTLLDLERGRIEVFGKGAKGYFRYFLTGAGLEFAKGEKIPLSFLQPALLTPNPLRLSFGIHKKQDWDLMVRRQELTELVPFWIKMAQWIPPVCLKRKGEGTLSLLEKGKFDLFFQAGFQGILSPRFNDENFLGLISEEIIPDSPIGLLHLSAEMLLKQFFYEEKNTFYFLPHLPTEFHSGKITSIETKEGDRIAMEWSKKLLKKVIIEPKSSRKVSLALKSKIAGFRLRRNQKEVGEKWGNKQPLLLEGGKILYLDCFTH